MLEIEIKYRCDSADRVRAILADLEALKVASQLEADTFYRSAFRDMEAADEVIRLRRVNGEAILTYKGPRRPGDTKTREEINLTLGGQESEAKELLAKLGLRADAHVSKHRELWELRYQGEEIAVSIDELPGIGIWCELEILAGEERFEKARKVLLALAANLELDHPERRSYLALSIEAKR